MTVSVQCQVNWKIETKGLSHSAYKQVFQFIMAIVLQTALAASHSNLKVRVVSIDLYISHNFKRSSTWITNLVPKPSRQAVQSKDLRWSEGFSYWIDQSDIFGYKAYLAFIVSFNTDILASLDICSLHGFPLTTFQKTIWQVKTAIWRHHPYSA